MNSKSNKIYLGFFGLLLLVVLYLGVLSFTKYFHNEPVRETTNATSAADPYPVKIGQPEMPDHFKVAFIADQGLNDNSKKVLELIKSEKAQMVLHDGDFDYADNPDAWAKQTDDILGKNFPYLAVIGNHDIKEWNKYQPKIAERLSNVPGMVCKGDIGVEGGCLFHGVNFAFSSPGITLPNTNYDHAKILAIRLAQSPTPWNVCAWHKDQRAMQLGDKEDEVGWAVYDTCRRGGAIIATGHEHSYERTYLMDNFETPSVVSTSSTLTLEKGKSFAFVSGLGGESIRPQKRDGSWWAAAYTATQRAKPGALFCTFGVTGTDGKTDSKKADCYFKDIGGKIVDTFSVVTAL